MDSSSRTAVVRVDDLVVVRGGRTVLPGISLDLTAGVLTGLLGPSGCGKSTLLRSIVGVQRIASGTIDVLGMPAGDASLRSRIGYLTQAPSVYEDLTVRENLEFFARVLGVPSARVEDVIDRVDLRSHQSAVVGTLSGGQRSRASLAVALVGDPELMVLDEPTVGLDPELRERLWTTFEELARAGAALIISSHVMEEAARCDRLLLMHEGLLIADGTPDEIRLLGGSADLDACFLAIVRARRAASAAVTG